MNVHDYIHNRSKSRLNSGAVYMYMFSYALASLEYFFKRLKVNWVSFGRVVRGQILVAGPVCPEAYMYQTVDG